MYGLIEQTNITQKEEEVGMPSNEDETRQAPNYVKEKKDWN
jgi:hypothetical protein